MQLGKRFPVRRKDADKVVEARRGSFAGAPVKGVVREKFGMLSY